MSHGGRGIVVAMGKPPNLIADIGPSPNIDHEQDMADNGAPKSAATLMYWLIGIGFVLLIALVGIGLHLPAGG